MTIPTIEDDFVVDKMNKILVTGGSTGSVRRSLGILLDCGWLKEVFPELDRMARFHTTAKSKDLWDHVLQVVENCPQDPVLRWAALFHDIGKPVCYVESDGIVSFCEHEKKGAEIWKIVAERINAPKLWSELIAGIIRESGSFVELKNLNTSGKLTDAAIRRYVKRVGPDLSEIFRFSMADMTSSWYYKRDRMRQETRALMCRIDKLVDADKKEAARLRLPKGTGTKIMRVLGLKGKELGIVMKELQRRLETGELGDDVVNEAILITCDFLIDDKT